MPNYDYMELLTTAQLAGTSQTAVGPLSLLPPQALHTIAPDDWYVGKALLIKAAGRVSNVVTAAPTFTFNLMFGATNVFTTGAYICSTTAHTTLPWYLEIMLTCRAVGATANLIGQAIMTSRAFVDVSGADVTTTGHPTLLGPETTPGVGGNFSSNTSQQVDLQYVLSTAAAGNAIQLEQYWLGQLN